MNYLNNLFSLQNKIAIVTGAANGNGKAISKALLKSRAKVVLVDNNKTALKNTKLEFKKQNLNPIEFVCDITDSKSLNELKKFILKKFNRIDILVNNAGVTFSSTANYPDELWEKTYLVNLKAPFELSKICCQLMKKQKSGVIINVTSINAELGFPDNPAYVSFKGALKQLSKSLALDYGKYDIRVNNVGPGYMRTNMTKKSWLNKTRRKKIAEKTMLGRWGIPDDLAGIVIFLCSNSSSYITGQDFYVDGGWLSKGL